MLANTMKRRRLLQAFAAAPAVPVLLGQSPASPAVGPRPTSPAAPAFNPAIPLAPNVQSPGPAAEMPTLTPSIADDVADTTPRFFTAAQFAALRKLADMMMPPMKGAPGALTAGAPEFLDFLIGHSPKERQHIYQNGLDALNSQSQKEFHQPFANVDAAQAATLLAPLRAPWTYDPPADPLARLLREAKLDIRTATTNSREYTAALSSGGGRRFGAGGLYWYPLD